MAYSAILFTSDTAAQRDNLSPGLCLTHAYYAQQKKPNSNELNFRRVQQHSSLNPKKIKIYNSLEPE